MEPSRESAAGYVYLLDLKRKIEGRPIHKIGLERSHITERPMSIKIAVPNGLELVRVAYFADPYEVERALYTHFNHYLLGGGTAYVNAPAEDLVSAFGALVRIQTQQDLETAFSHLNDTPDNEIAGSGLSVDVVSLDVLETFGLQHNPESNGQKGAPVDTILIFETPGYSAESCDWWRDGAFDSV